MKKIYINEILPRTDKLLSNLRSAGITCELKINAAEDKFPYFTFSELCLSDEEDYNRAVSLIFNKGQATVS